MKLGMRVAPHGLYIIRDLCPQVGKYFFGRKSNNHLAKKDKWVWKSGL